jgi:hypothetical protein
LHDPGLGNWLPGPGNNLRVKMVLAKGVEIKGGKWQVAEVEGRTWREAMRSVDRAGTIREALRRVVVALGLDVPAMCEIRVGYVDGQDAVQVLWKVQE